MAISKFLMQKIASVLVAVSVAVPVAIFVLLPLPSVAQFPACESAVSDSDNDGWGWENDSSCRVISDSPSDAEPSVQVQSASENFIDSSNPTVTAAAHAEPYPSRDPFKIKALKTDHWDNRSELLQAGIEGVAINFVWSYWESDNTQAPCRPNRHRFANRCYRIPSNVDREVQYWSRQGKNVTAVLWGVPEWARDDQCINTLTGRSIFCSTDSASAFGDFAGMLASRYNSANANGLINDYVIHNEVNMYEWYNHRCSTGQNCDLNAWIENYAESYNAAYDKIKSVNSAAKVFVPLAHQFASDFDNLSAERSLISGQTFLRGFNSFVGGREWKLAYHPYNKNLLVNGFSPNDWPHVTLGNIGVLSGWLRSEFPLQPASWEIYLTESGYNSVAPHATEQGQATDLCRSFYNALGTPGIENYVYHRMSDNEDEVVGGLGLGLRAESGRAKQAWGVWANANGRPGNRSNLSCGFENLPYTKVSTFTHPDQATRTSSRLVYESYQLQSTIWLMRNHVADAVMVYECSLNGGSYLSHDAACEGRLSLGPVGYAYRNSAGGRRTFYSCASNTGDRFVSDNNSCGGAGSLIEFLGYSVLR